ncbi:MAG: hypothetical protein GVX90_05370, partial [Alphaproteobacteria bacterium]|nr:hypothetical protein [Alphaproteobacteria bacterium]
MVGNSITRRAAAIGMAAALAAGGAGAESGSSFKRVKVGAPQPGVPRITVQIDPAEQARILAANPAVPPRPETADDPEDRADSAPDSVPDSERGAGDATYAWYWDEISPDQGAASSGRLDAAVAALARGPGGARVPAPRLATLERIAADHGPAI